jgi:hypothetical protein
MVVVEDGRSSAPVLCWLLERCRGTSFKGGDAKCKQRLIRTKSIKLMFLLFTVKGIISLNIISSWKYWKGYFKELKVLHTMNICIRTYNLSNFLPLCLRRKRQHLRFSWFTVLRLEVKSYHYVKDENMGENDKNIRNGELFFMLYFIAILQSTQYT